MLAVPEQGFRRVLHADLDCFFAAVEELDDPSLRGKPVIVGGDPDKRGVVSTANYIARRFGVHSAMSAALARRQCPQAVFLRPRFERYLELSRAVMAILDEHVLVREQVSVDEAYGELPRGQPGCVPAETIARTIKARVRRETGLTISIGVGRSRSIAKLASDLSKPDGCLVVRPGAERAFLDPLPVGKLHGVGPQTRERLHRLGILSAGDLARYDVSTLERLMGKHGRWLWELANARDDRPVVAESAPPKSISREDTYERDIADVERAAENVRDLAASVARRAAAKGMQGRVVTLKVKWADFRIMTRQQALHHYTQDAGEIATAAQGLLFAEVAPLLNPDTAIRLLGVGLSSLCPEGSPERRVTAAHGLVQLPLWAHAS